MQVRVYHTFKWNTIATVLGCFLLASSKTSNNTLKRSEKWTTSLQQTDHLPPTDFTIDLIHFEPPRSGHPSTPYSRQIASKNRQ